MPNAGKKKHIKPKKEKVNAMEYAKAFVASIGDKSRARGLALIMAKNAKGTTPPDDKTSNFWNNIAGHIGKV